jgi:HEAT repeat protein
LPVENTSANFSDESPFVPVSGPKESGKEIELFYEEKGLVSMDDDDSGVPSDILKRLSSPEAYEREIALGEIVSVGGDDAFRCITRAFDDPSANVRNAAARSLFDLQADRAATFTRALREGTPERRRKIGQALATSGLAKDAVRNLTGESREKTYDAFSLLFLMAKAGEVQPLLQAIEDYPNVEVRIAVVKLLALSGQPEVVPAFRRLAVRGSLPSEVRSAVMEAIYQISSQARDSAPSLV